MAYTTINKHTDYFNTKLYTGNGSTNAQTGVGFQPDLTWIKRRNNTGDHLVADAVRGANKNIRPNTTAAESDDGAIHLNSFDSDGFTVGGTGTHSNGNGDTYVAWNWKAGTTGTGYTTGSGTSKAYSYSVNTTAGFSIIKFEGNGTAGHTIPHHLGAVPKMVFAKNLDNTGGYGWYVQHNSLGTDKVLYLHSTDAQATNTTAYNSTHASSSVVTLGTNAGTNGNGENILMYCFAEKKGYSKFGTYAGNNNTNGTFVYTGFSPAFVLVKRYGGGTQNWGILDNKRPGYNLTSKMLNPNTNVAEGTNNGVDLLSNGFKFRSSDGNSNGYSDGYIYAAFAEQPLVGTNNIPATAR